MTDQLEPKRTIGDVEPIETKPLYEPPQIVDLSGMAQAQGGTVGVPICGNGSAVLGVCASGPAPGGICSAGTSPRISAFCNVGVEGAGN